MSRQSQSHPVNMKAVIIGLLAFMMLILAVTEYKKLFGGYVNIDNFYHACQKAAKLYYKIPEGVAVFVGVPDKGRITRGSTIFSESLLHDRRIIVQYDKDGKNQVHYLRCVIDERTRAAILLP